MDPLAALDAFIAACEDIEGAQDYFDLKKGLFETAHADMMTAGAARKTAIADLKAATDSYKTTLQGTPEANWLTDPACQAAKVNVHNANLASQAAQDTYHNAHIGFENALKAYEGANQNLLQRKQAAMDAFRALKAAIKEE